MLINFCSIFFVFKFVPETKGRTLEGLEEEFRTRDTGEVRAAPVAAGAS